MIRTPAASPLHTDDPRSHARRIRSEEQRYREEYADLNGAFGSFVISYPKSGRTWHRLMIGNYLAQATGSGPRQSFDIDGLCQLAGLAPICYSHNGANFLDALPPRHPVVASPALWRGRTVLLLTRDPADILVSAWHHARFRTKSFAGGLSDFIRQPESGLNKILAAYNRWHDHRGEAARFEVVSYEDMHRDPAGVLRQSLQLFGIAAPDPAMLTAAVDFTRFDRMRDFEETDYFRSGRMRNVSGDERAAKVREGSVGGAAAHLSADDLDFIARRTARLGNPWAPRSAVSSSALR